MKKVKPKLFVKSVFFCLVMLLFSVSHADANIYRWDNGALLSEKDIGHYLNPPADLSYLYLPYADLSTLGYNTNAAYANMNNATFETAVGQSTIGGVNFSNANLSGANFYNTSIGGADLSGANLSGADFRINYYNGATTFTGAFYDDNTLFNNDFNPATLGIVYVPEPTTIALLGFGALGLLRRKKSA
ncbi:MAG: pentapeptide repeat-containing protein [Planctomycetes bacterium]|nr:pentapeptide repeat-containing protein [Planctomycetota bacterium]